MARPEDSPERTVVHDGETPAPREKPLRRPAEERGRGSTEEHGRILVMEDDEVVRSLTESLLRRFGYTVETAREGNEAIEKYRAAKERGAPFDVAIIDLTIVDGMNGVDTIVALRAFDPDVKAIVTTGYFHENVRTEYLGHGFRGVLPKPFRAEELRAAVRKVLEEGS